MIDGLAVIQVQHVVQNLMQSNVKLSNTRERKRESPSFSSSFGSYPEAFQSHALISLINLMSLISEAVAIRAPKKIGPQQDSSP